MAAVNPEGLERYEMIEGVVYDMSPSPSEGHQRATTAIGSLFFSAFKGQCRTYVSPFDVWPTGDTKDAYVQPDVAVICNSNKITHDGCVGAPDLVVEVLSPSTAGKDRKAKLRLYQRSGVREYWIVDPVMRTVEVFCIDQNAFGPAETYAAGEDEFVPVGIKEGLRISLGDIFD
ncbi:MAG: Uma2 family endonuclease [Firmicutes bacterium]|nr:Uma2 family endonuclease [Bacillota bacterium]